MLNVGHSEYVINLISIVENLITEHTLNIKPDVYLCVSIYVKLFL